MAMSYEKRTQLLEKIALQFHGAGMPDFSNHYIGDFNSRISGEISKGRGGAGGKGDMTAQEIKAAAEKMPYVGHGTAAGGIAAGATAPAISKAKKKADEDAAKKATEAVAEDASAEAPAEGE